MTVRNDNNNTHINFSLLIFSGKSDDFVVGSYDRHSDDYFADIILSDCSAIIYGIQLECHVRKIHNGTDLCVIRLMLGALRCDSKKSLTLKSI